MDDSGICAFLQPGMFIFPPATGIGTAPAHPRNATIGSFDYLTSGANPFPIPSRNTSIGAIRRRTMKLHLQVSDYTLIIVRPATKPMEREWKGHSRPWSARIESWGINQLWCRRYWKAFREK